MWHDRILPPEPDDSLVYSGHIYSVARCPYLLCNYPSISLRNETGFLYLSYRLFWGIISKVLQLNPITTYELSFYVGTVMLIPVLILFLQTMFNSRRLTAVGLLALALFYGHGGYHGFFWVVPSFYALMLFFLILSLCLSSSKYTPWLIGLIMPAYIFMHPTSVYFLAILPIFWLTYVIFSNRWHFTLLRNASIALLLGAVIFSSVKLVFHHTPSPYSIDAAITMQNLSSQLSWKNLNVSHPDIELSPLQTILPSLSRFFDDYVNWIFPHWLGLIPFLVFIALFVAKRNYKFLALFTTVVVFVLASSIHPYGYRALILIWPLTFILYGLGIFYLWEYTHSLRFRSHLIKRMLQVGIAVFALGFISANLVFSIVYADFENKKNNIAISPDYSSQILAITSPDEPVAPMDKILMSYSLNTELISYPQMSPNGQSKYYSFYTNQEPEKLTALDYLLAGATYIFTGKNTLPVLAAEPKPDNSPILPAPRYQPVIILPDIKVYEDKNYVSPPQTP